MKNYCQTGFCWVFLPSIHPKLSTSALIYKPVKFNPCLRKWIVFEYFFFHSFCLCIFSETFLNLYTKSKNQKKSRSQPIFQNIFLPPRLLIIWGLLAFQSPSVTFLLTKLVACWIFDELSYLLLQHTLLPCQSVIC